MEYTSVSVELQDNVMPHPRFRFRLTSIIIDGNEQRSGSRTCTGLMSTVLGRMDDPNNAHLRSSSGETLMKIYDLMLAY